MNVLVCMVRTNFRNPFKGAIQMHGKQKFPMGSQSSKILSSFEKNSSTFYVTTNTFYSGAFLGS